MVADFTFATRCLLCWILLLAGCATQPTAPLTQTNNQQAQETATRDQNPVELLSYYQRLAKTSDATEAAYYQLLTAEIYSDIGEFEAATTTLKAISRTQLELDLYDRVLALEARLAAENKQYALALQKLPKPKPNHPDHMKWRILETKAIALTGANYSVDGVLAYIELVQANPASPNMNLYNQAIWKELNRLNDIERQEITKQSQNELLDGWIKLVNALEIGRLSGYSDEVVIRSWKQQHITHPAYNFADTILILDFENETINFQADHIALLLPLTDEKIANAANAIQRGFLSAYYDGLRFAESSNDPVRVSVYDSTDLLNNLDDTLAKMQAADVDVIIGPLAKLHVDAIINANSDMLVLTLNQTTATTSNNNVFQFGLLPENEAQQAAELAISRNEKTAAILYPRSQFGLRLYSAFKERYEALGGEILSESFYIETASDHKAAIQRIFNIHHSYNRQAILSTTLQRKPVFEPRHREDIDAIFVIANSVQGRLIKPQLKFHNIVDIPTYSTSRIYAGPTDSIKDRDLNGVVFTETPWLLYKDLYQEFTALNQIWPSDTYRYARLYAMGVDAYFILDHLARLQSNNEERFRGVSGVLYLDEQQKIQRELVWAQFTDGEAQVLDFTELDKDQVFEENAILEPQ